jgi:hypothetical protein
MLFIKCYCKEIMVVIVEKGIFIFSSIHVAAQAISETLLG